MGVQDGASLLAAAVTRQRLLLHQLKERLSRLGPCKLELAEGGSSETLATRTLVAVAGDDALATEEPAVDAISRIYKVFGVDMVGAKSLISESEAALTKATG